jgi:nucleoid DNA-binding protein
MRIYFCVANNPDGIEVVPRSLSRIRQGKYWVPDCADYQTKFNLPRRLKAKEIFAGWSCFNCRFLKEESIPEEKKIVQPSPRRMPRPGGPLRPPEAQNAPQVSDDSVSHSEQKTDQPKETLTRQMLAKEVSETLEMPQRDADTIISYMFAAIAQCLSKHESVKLKDFGVFDARPRKGRTGRHPSTGEEIQISDGFTVRFRPSKKLKECVADGLGKPEESS